VTRRASLGLAALAIAGLAVGVVATRGASGQDPSMTAAERTAMATVARRNLVSRDTLPGTLSFADSRPLGNEHAGTITRLPREGSLVKRGGVLYEVDETPVFLMNGRTPLWRPLAAGVSDGADVRQLEANLVALGYDDERAIAVDRHWDWATTAALRLWQDDRGLTEDGTLDLGEVLFLPGPRRIGTLKVEVGSRVAPGTSVMDTSSTRRVVMLDLDARRQTLVREGDRVRVHLPDGRQTGGRIVEVGKVARAAGSNEPPTIAVTIALRRRRAGSLDQAPVEVEISKEYRENVLTVPVTALLALPGGSYAVEVSSDDGTRLLRVRPGLFADGLVEVSGADLREGMRVVVAE
jgi:multidrug efflux pump subunit AcrA (membrane-fusion protein)